MKRKRIGILAQYLNSRHDIREYIGAMALEYDVVVFLRPNDKHLEALVPKGVDVRMIQAQVFKSLRNHLMVFLYRLFGKLPESEHNYFITEFFKLGNEKYSFWKKSIEKFWLHLSRYTPKWISYDGYLKSLNYNASTPLDDIDCFLCFTQIYDDLFFAHLLDSGKPVKVYVYSWDHPCKMKTFSHRVHEYLVWNEGLKNDLISLQSIDEHKIRVYGSSQLTYIDDYLHEPKRKPYYDFDYLYFACATGYPTLVKQEVEVILETAHYLKENFPVVKLVVRTYPFFGAETYYRKLHEADNIVIDDYKERFPSSSDAHAQIIDKFVKIEFARSVIHFGTTFGLEASYFKAPVILADIVKNQKELHEFVHQYQNDKYLNIKSPNTPKNWENYKKALKDVLEEKSEMFLYNSKLASDTSLRSMKELVQQF